METSVAKEHAARTCGIQERKLSAPDRSGRPGLGRPGLGRPSLGRPSLCHHAVATVAALGTQAGTTFDFAWLFIIFPASHFFLDATPFDQFTKTADRLLNRFTIPNRQLNHIAPFRITNRNNHKPRIIINFTAACLVTSTVISPRMGL